MLAMQYDDDMTELYSHMTMKSNHSLIAMMGTLSITFIPHTCNALYNIPQNHFFTYRMPYWYKCTVSLPSHQQQISTDLDILRTIMCSNSGRILILMKKIEVLQI